MNTKKYLNRINYVGTPSVDLNTLTKLHECHVLNIPFENLDIQYKTEIILEKEPLFKKIIQNCRGGFCYEVNYLFYLLLITIGFDVIIISARIFEEDKLGPEYDHMAILIKLNGKNWLADVGFGDLFIKPLQIDNLEEQFDGRNYFKIKPCDKKSFLLFMSKNKKDYEKKYLLKIQKQTIKKFSQQCLYKQHSPSSYFVKNKVITLPILNGRKTIFNANYIVKINHRKTKHLIKNKKEENRILKEEFNIII